MADEQKRVPFNGAQVHEGWPEKVKAAQEIAGYEIGDKSYARIPYGSEHGFDDGVIPNCHDCAVIVGQFHVPGCDVEECPACGGQSISCDCPDDDDDDPDAFSFSKHRDKAISDFLRRRGQYESFTSVMKAIISQSLIRRGIKVLSLESRVKDPESFGNKAAKVSDSDPSAPRYPSPLQDITDICAVRVITFFPSTLPQIDKMLSEEFKVVERSDKSEVLRAEEKFGYSSVHYLVQLSDTRLALSEYQSYVGIVAEIQVRTVLQHAWAEIEHDIQYKSSSVIPADIRRRFVALAGVLEFADHEFQAIQDADQEVRAKARIAIEKGKLKNVEITPDAVKQFLATRFGPDKRVTWQSYDFVARLLRTLGFRNLDQVETCIANFDDAQLSKIVFNGRVSPVWRLEACLLAGMGALYVQRHFLAAEEWFMKGMARALDDMEKVGVKVGAYNPDQ